ncbi:helix-turn-helix domain-containing protein [Comamonas sp. GB3 AK4-5]|uniref:helix-turn-helix transcriptional regulator n=1 Tax=Comamonas sp. GB3 AK4-5 TaxID=3231487 RepID=UPI00351DBAF8
MTTAEPLKAWQGTWRYWPSPTPDAVETCQVQGRQVALPAHFHAEDQLVVVLQGRRRIVVGENLFSAEAGQTLFIPAGIVHHSLAEAQDLLCINAYLPPARHGQQDLRQHLGMAWRAGKLRCQEDMQALLEQLRAGRAGPCAAEPHRERLHIGLAASVREAALTYGFSREHYARQFKLQHGVSPQTHRLLQRLNLARECLRAGQAIAEAALDAGFTDQSHLSRAFKRSFGVSPGRYRPTPDHMHTRHL